MYTIYIYIYIYEYNITLYQIIISGPSMILVSVKQALLSGEPLPCSAAAGTARQPQSFYIPQRGVQWKQGVVVYIML